MKLIQHHIKFYGLSKTLKIILLPKIFKRVSMSSLTDINPSKIRQLNIEYELYYLPKLLNDSSVVFDIGANIGQFTFVFSNYVKQNNLYAFEPIPWLFLRIKKLYPKIQAFNLALSNKTSTAKIFIPTINGSPVDTRSSLEFKENNSPGNFIDIETTTIDSIVKQQNLMKIDLIKIDVEGHELHTLEGGYESIKTFYPYIMVELDSFIDENTVLKASEFLQNLGYTAYYFDKTTFRIRENFSNLKDIQNTINRGVNKQYINNFLFVPENKQSDFEKSKQQIEIEFSNS